MDLQTLNFSEKNELCHLMTKHGSDKGNGWHNYTIVYHELFKNIKYNKLNIFEFGIGTTNVSFPSSMGPTGKPGASLRGWREYFPNSIIYGADIDKEIIFEEDRIHTFFVDQLNSSVIKDMWEKIPEDFEIIVDDGFHDFHANINSLENSFYKLKENGIYIIEDVHQSKISLYENYFKDTIYNYQILNIPNPSNSYGDNVLIIIRKI
jgi:hypothetical protein